jgi:hypothetical protein
VKDSGSYQILSTNGTATTFTFDKGSASVISCIDAYGSGSITSLAGDFELAVVDVDGTKYGSVADAKAAGGDASTIKVVDSTGAVVDKTTAENGLSAAVCAALGLAIGDKDANIAVAPAATDSDPNNITLAVNVADAPEASAVKYEVKKDGVFDHYSDSAAAVTIPLEAGNYTITPVLK